MEIPDVQILKTESRQFLRFLIVGVSGTLVDFGLLAVLKSAGVTTLLANSISFGAGTVNNFTLNRLWTFKHAGVKKWQDQFFPFMLVSLAGLVLNSLVVVGFEILLKEVFYFGDWSYLPAKIIATGLVVFWNYFANCRWTFGDYNFSN